MKLKRLSLGLGALGLVCAAYLVWPEWFGFCEKIETVTRGEICRAPYATSLGKPLLPFTLSFLVMSLLASFTTRKTFLRWARFTLGYGIAAGILMYLAAVAGIDDGGFVSIPLFDIEEVAQWLASIYAVISLLLLGISDFLARRKKSGAYLH